ncbi:MAG: NADH-quinone oxidoreductase subunit NuoE [Ignavibacteriaceae bacterium]|nr:NADH-quinone oxidoreductase subunit NuoE [Ignavibacterium sp.]MCC6254346.1 NADH-quinone oxidoreductase subunit NuoE [Ignavibacteriaceae bacterium]HMN23406.1 NADH-quinone oxidoreductase subunit NuoE [Ignavibacteriaceae bacterium]HRN25542.1 NADH-quinone oxidoreductase subunit NuoE [Ignavibacteriaceae bacterium]HRP92699.1 NADH-quinone oxidoreductase subunit NuoE [Ignavibacteriaceae bacterium]
MSSSEFKFTSENIERINKEIAKYPEKQPAVMATLYIAQEQNGYISNEVMKEVATILDMTSEEVLGIVTFYTMYFQKPMGKNHIQVCTNVSCMLRGGYEIWNQVKEKLGVDNMGVTADQKFSLEEVECLGSCGTAPMIAVNEDYYENLTKDKVEEILKSLS